MRKQLEFKLLASLSLAIFFLLFLAACDHEPVEDRPELPPVESLVMDFSDFSEAPAGAKSTAATHMHFMHAFGTVLVWNTVSSVTLALPLAAYGRALQEEPEYVGDHTWEWSYEISWGDQQFSATLTGTRLNNEEFSMKMVIAPAQMPDKKVKWFEGVVRYDHTHATWTLYKEENTAILQAEWSKDFEKDEATLVYTYVEQGKSESGSQIRYEYNPEEFYDATFIISLSSGTTRIEWSRTTKEGRVMDLEKFGDTSWHCWDSFANGLVDMSCN